MPRKKKIVTPFSEKNIFAHNQDQLDNKQSLFNIGEDIRNKQNDVALSVMINWRGVETLVYRPDNPKKQPRKGYNDTDGYNINKSYREAYGVFGDSFRPNDDNYDFMTKVLIYQDSFTAFDEDTVSLPGNSAGYILSDFQFKPDDVIKVMRKDIKDRFFIIVSEEQFGTTQSVIKKYIISNYNR